jgi:hypothetical protein
MMPQLMLLGGGSLDHLMNLFSPEQQKILMTSITKCPIQNGNQLRTTLEVSSRYLDSEQRASIWEAVQGKLGTIIKNGLELWDLFALPKEQLDREQRTQIWEAVNGQLGTIIKDGLQLQCLFALSSDELNSEQRTQILNAVQGQLGTMIKNGYQLQCFFELSNDQLNLEQRQMILSSCRKDIRLIFLQRNPGQLSFFQKPAAQDDNAANYTPKT